MPFGLNFQGMNGWLYDGGGIELWNEVYAPFGMVAMPCGNTGVQMTGWFKKEIKSVADLKGLKMRIPGLAGKVYATLGVDVKLLPGGEIFPALERGVIDAAEFVGPYQDRRLGLQKAAKYYYTTGWHESATVSELLINKAAWDKLPKDLQAIVENAAAACNVISEAWCQKHQRRGDGRPDQEPGRDRPAAARRGDQGAARGDRQGAGRSRRQGPDDEEGARLVHGLQGQVRPLGRAQRRGVPQQGPRLMPQEQGAPARLAARIEALIDVVGRATLYLALAMIVLVATNVLLRYAFSFGSVWSQELEWHLLAPLILFGMSYALPRGEHVRVDVLYANFAPRTKFFVDVLSACCAADRAALHLAVARLRAAVVRDRRELGRPGRPPVPLGC